MIKLYKTGKRPFLILLLAAVFMVYMALAVSPALSADALYRFMHGDQDALILGEIVSIENGVCEVAVKDTIISANNFSSSPKQMKPEKAYIDAAEFENFDPFGGSPAIGDCILASVMQEKGGNFSILWGVYKVDSLERHELSVIVPEKSKFYSDEDFRMMREYRSMDAAAIESFIHSDGKNTEFFFNGDTFEVGLYAEGARTAESGEIIYRGGAWDLTQTVLQLDSEEIQIADAPAVTPEASAAAVSFTAIPDIVPTSAAAFAPVSGVSAQFVFAACAVVILSAVVVSLLIIRRGKTSPL